MLRKLFLRIDLRKMGSFANQEMMSQTVPHLQSHRLNYLQQHSATLGSALCE